MPDITVTDVPPINVYSVAFPLPPGITTTTFPFSFAVLNSEQISVFITPVGAPANDAGQIKNNGTDYTVFINPAPAIGGMVTLTVAAPQQSRVTIVRNTPIVRTSAYSDGALLAASVLNGDCNSSVMIEQELNRYATMLSPHYNQTEITDASDYVLPRLVRGQVWVKGLVPGTTTGQEAIIAESITNVLGGAPVSLINGPTTQLAIAKFADTAGNITGTTVKIDAANNIVAPANITAAAGTVTAATIRATVSSSAQTFNGTNLNVTNATINTLLTAANGSATNLANTTITGTLTVNGIADIPGLVLGNINLPQNNITAARISAPIITSTDMLNAISAEITGSLTVTAGGTTTISNQLIADNYSPANFRPGVIAATGSINAQGAIYSPLQLITDTSLVIRNPANISTTINRTPGGTIYTLSLPNSLGDLTQMLALTEINNNQGTLSWVDGGGGGGGITATLPITAGNIPRFTDANGNVGNSAAILGVGGDITATTLSVKSTMYPARISDFHIGPLMGLDYVISNSLLGDNINIATGGAGAVQILNYTPANSGILRICDSSNNKGVTLTVPANVAATYSLTLPTAAPTAVNQPLIVTALDGQGQSGNILGWGTPTPKRAYGVLRISANGELITTQQINMNAATWYNGTHIAGTIDDAIGIQLNFAADTFTNFYYMVTVSFARSVIQFIAQTEAVGPGRTNSLCIIHIITTNGEPARIVELWREVPTLFVECTAVS